VNHTIIVLKTLDQITTSQTA